MGGPLFDCSSVAFMVNDIPMFDRDAVLNAQNVRGIVAFAEEEVEQRFI
jgi:hypothetical protein